MLFDDFLESHAAGLRSAPLFLRNSSTISATVFGNLALPASRYRFSRALHKVPSTMKHPAPAFTPTANNLWSPIAHQSSSDAHSMPLTGVVRTIRDRSFSRLFSSSIKVSSSVKKVTCAVLAGEPYNPSRKPYSPYLLAELLLTSATSAATGLIIS